MKISLVADEPSAQPCADCTVRPFSVCAALDRAELRELEHIGRHIHVGSGETVFAQEEMTTSFYNLLDGVMRLYKLLPDGRRQIVGFALPGDFLGMAASARHGFSADTIGRSRSAGSRALPLPGLSMASRICYAESTSRRFAS
jgi:CRP/FNR family transcriptional regulator